MGQDKIPIKFSTNGFRLNFSIWISVSSDWGLSLDSLFVLRAALGASHESLQSGRKMEKRHSDVEGFLQEITTATKSPAFKLFLRSCQLCAIVSVEDSLPLLNTGVISCLRTFMSKFHWKMSGAELCCQDTLLSFGDSRGRHWVVYLFIQSPRSNNHLISNSSNFPTIDSCRIRCWQELQKLDRILWAVASVWCQPLIRLTAILLILFSYQLLILVDSPGQFSLELKPEVAKTQSHERSWPCTELNEFREAGIGQHCRLKWCSFLGTESFNSIEFLVKITGKGDSLTCETHGFDVS